MKIWGGFEFWFESLWNIRSEYAIRFVLSFKVKVFFNLICPWFRIFTFLAFILSKICSSLWMRYPVLTHTFNNHLWTIQIDTKFHWFRVLYTYICWFDQYAVREKKLKFSSDGLKKKNNNFDSMRAPRFTLSAKQRFAISIHNSITVVQLSKERINNVKIGNAKLSKRDIDECIECLIRKVSFRTFRRLDYRTIKVSLWTVISRLRFSIGYSLNETKTNTDRTKVDNSAPF